MNKNKPFFNLSLSALFTAAMVICSFLAVPTPIPFTLQTFAVFLACSFLGFKGAFLSTLTYILLGLVGLPIFAGFKGGVSALLEPTGGFILGFLFIPLFYGIFCRVFGKRAEAIGLFAGLLICYLTGSLWCLLYTDRKSYPIILLTSVAPFIIPDIIKLATALYLAKALKKATEKQFKKEKKIKPSVICANMKNKAEIFVFSELDSTNSEAVRRLRQGCRTPALFLAEKQTAGRGRRGRSFFSEGGLYMTVALSEKNLDTVGITTLAAVVVSESIEELTGIKTGIKWVNDLYFGDKKICGILCEMVKEPEPEKELGTIVGIGVNLNIKTFPKEISSIAGSIYVDISREVLAAKITDRLLNELNNPTNHIERYKSRSLVLGKVVSFEQNGETRIGTAIDIAESGGLIIATEGGKNETLSSGEISLRITR